MAMHEVKMSLLENMRLNLEWMTMYIVARVF